MCTLNIGFAMNIFIPKTKEFKTSCCCNETGFAWFLNIALKSLNFTFLGKRPSRKKKPLSGVLTKQMIEAKEAERRRINEVIEMTSLNLTEWGHLFYKILNPSFGLKQSLKIKFYNNKELLKNQEQDISNTVVISTFGNWQVDVAGIRTQVPKRWAVNKGGYVTWFHL